MAMTTASSNWSDLPADLQALFMKKLVSYKDYIRFGAVCKSWYSTLLQFQFLDPKQVPPHLPLLMIPSSSSIDNVLDETEETRSFYCIPRKMVYDDLRIKLPANMYCRGSSHGWLVVVEEDETFSVRLFNPFLSVNNEIQLPPLTALEIDPKDSEVDDHKFMEKVIISVDPTSNPNDCVVMMIYGSHYKLAFCRSGDIAWTSLPFEWQGFSDVIYHMGMFYAINYRGGLVVVCDLTGSGPKVRKVAQPPCNDYGGDKKYIVESSADLLQVHRYITYKDTLTGPFLSFTIFKLVSEGFVDGIGSQWVEIKFLSGHMLFLGDNASISLPASEYPGCKPNKPNSIYFTYDNAEAFLPDRSDGPRDIGVFNLEDGTTLSITTQYLNLANPSGFYPKPEQIICVIQDF